MATTPLLLRTGLSQVERHTPSRLYYHFFFPILSVKIVHAIHVRMSKIFCLSEIIYTLQGSEQKPGLAILAMAEIISTAEMLGKSVMISMYEIYQEHAYDLLNPSRPAIMVMEDAQGRIQLKGLSQVRPYFRFGNKPICRESTGFCC